VSKETLYRWWHSKTEVVLDAMAEYGQQAVPLPGTGTLLGDLREFLRATADSADPPTVSVLRHLAAAAAADEGEAIQIRDRFLARRRAALGELLDRAAARGEIEAGYAALARDLIYGSLWYRLVFRVGPVDHAWAEDVAAMIAGRTSPGTLGTIDPADRSPADGHGRKRHAGSSSTTGMVRPPARCWYT
jgi:AcrR family transcriptional regulator